MSPTPPPVRLVVLYGGQSAEHDVSRVSAAHVLRAVDTSRYEVDPVAGQSGIGGQVMGQQLGLGGQEADQGVEHAGPGLRWADRLIGEWPC